MIRIGALQIDFERRQVLRDEISVAVGSRAFDILELLSGANGALVSKERIMRSVWPDTIVEQNNLQVQVAALRKMLDPHGKLIVTEAGRGYRLKRTMFHSDTQGTEETIVTSTKTLYAMNRGHGELFGRESLVAKILTILNRFESLTLVGAGGIGKTRLALEAACRAAPSFPDGVAFVSLAEAFDETAVLAVVATALQIGTTCTSLSLELIVRLLDGKRLLVVLDTCEHVVDVASRIGAALRDAACVVLATSREPLGIQNESLCTVPPLDVPHVGNSPIEVLRTAAVRLFISRIEALEPAFVADERRTALVGEICSGLDGVPLAIELAVPRAAMLGVEALCNGRGESLRFLTGGLRTALPRHQSMTATIDWSYRLLNEPERWLLRRLSVFAGDFSLNAVRSVVEDEGLSCPCVLDAFCALVAKSMIVPLTVGSQRLYHLLKITREYALEQLDANGERGSAQEAHAQLTSKRLKNTPIRICSDSVSEVEQ
jgi:predicted ATPase/DNA-binding winged helix-turn-helix (wHTH) protein